MQASYFVVLGIDRVLGEITMARLKDELIEQLKQNVSLLRLVESQGYQLKPHGKDKAIQCPFHSDETASCIISP